VRHFVLSMLKNANYKWMMNCLRITGNFIAIDERYCTEMVFGEDHLLESLKVCLTIGSSTHKKEALWVISNVAANSEADAMEILNRGLITNLIFSSNDKNADLRKEAVWAISNMCAIITD
jgi:hypothetical protein